MRASLIFLLCFAPLPVMAQVKMGSNMVCYGSNDPYYERIYSKTVFGTMVDCLDAGGVDRQLMTNRAEQTQVESATASRSHTVTPVDETRIQREFTQLEGFESWLPNTTQGCREVRDQLLADMSAVPVEWSEDGCRVNFGHWRDVNTGNRLTDPQRIDLFHLIPLNWAQERGAAAWPEWLRAQFYRDPRNLRTSLPENRASMEGETPLSLLLANTTSSCAYIYDFATLVQDYHLTMTVEEWTTIRTRMNARCVPNLEQVDADRQARAELVEAQRQAVQRDIDAGVVRQEGLRTTNAPPAPAYIRMPDGSTRSLTPEERWGNNWIEKQHALGHTSFQEYHTERARAGEYLLHYHPIEGSGTLDTREQRATPEQLQIAKEKPPIANPGQGPTEQKTDPSIPTATTIPGLMQGGPAGAQSTPMATGQNTVGSPTDFGDFGDVVLPPSLQGLDRLGDDLPELDTPGADPAATERLIRQGMEELMRQNGAQQPAP